MRKGEKAQGILGTEPAAGEATVFCWANAYKNIEGRLAGTWTGGVVPNGTWSTSTRMTMTLNCATGQASDGTTTKKGSAFVKPTKNASRPIGIFGRAPGTAGENCDARGVVRIYSIKIYEGDQLAANYVPQVREMRGGLYDTIAQAFYTDSEHYVGSGGDIEEIDCEDKDPYVSSPDGDVYLKLPVYAQSNTTFFVDFQFLPLEKGEDGKPLGTSYLLENGYATKSIVARIIADKTYNGAITLNYANKKSHVSTGVQVEDMPTWRGRHTVTLDPLANLGTLCTRGHVEFEKALRTAGPLTNRTDCPVYLLTWVSNNKPEPPYARARLYGMKVYENNDLVYDYVPRRFAFEGEDEIGVLYERVSRGVLVSSTATNLSYSANVKKLDLSAYVESSGDQIVELDYAPNSNSVITIDAQYTEVATYKALAGCDYGGTGVGFQINENKNFAGVIRSEQTGNIGAGSLDRCTFTYDATRQRFARSYRFVEVNSRTSTKQLEQAATNMALFAFLKTNGSALYPCKAKIFSAMFSEKGIVKRLYYPFVWNGELGFRDLVTGHFARGRADKSALTSGGNVAVAGDLDVFPSDTRIPHRGVANLTAHATGAVGYRWTCNGTPLSATNSTVQVSWEKRDKTELRDTYSVTPQYSFYETEFAGKSKSFVVEHERGGLVIIYR